MARGKICKCCSCKASCNDQSLHQSDRKCCLPGCKGCANEDSRPMEERLKAIEYHWSSFSNSAKRFLLQQPSALTIRKFLDFFSQPQEIAFATMSVSVGTAHMLAYEYSNIGAFANAKALALCGAFFLQCQSPATPIEEMIKMPIKDERNPVELPQFSCGVRATVSNDNVSRYLKKALPLKYQKMLGLEGHSQNAPGMKYVDLIGNDWNGTSKSKNTKHQKGGDSTEITIVILNNDDGTKYKKCITMDTTLKTLFNGYADECGASLRLLRFSFNGTTLFLSSVGRKTPHELGMKSMDVIIVTNMQVSESKNDENTPTKSNTKPAKKTKKSRKAGKKKQGRNTSSTHTQQTISLPESDMERNKLVHSKLLSKVFEEMQPKLKVIRQQLNDLLLDRQSSKKKRSSLHKKKAPQTSNIVFNPLTVGVGGKAGKTSFLVNVGRVENLYKTGKRHQSKTPSMAKVDLHGCTKDEALERLGSSLCEWMDTAMHGSYPWVIPASIVCGGGHQILSETVEKWIKETKTVANAPKGSIALY